MEVTPVSEYWGQLLSSGVTIYAGLIYRVPPRLWRNLSNVQKELRKIDSRQLYTTASTFHVSVKGLGYLGEDIDRTRYEHTISRIQSIISDIEPFQVSLRGLGVFPTGIHARVDDGNKFREINERISKELRGEVDHSIYDSESFVPHVTLASFNTKDVSRLIEKAESDEMKSIEFGDCGVYEFELVRTNLILALGPEETQDRAFSYIRSFWLGKFTR